MTRLSLVIPAYNEEARLPALLEAIGKNADETISRSGFELLEVLIVDDGSTDGTSRLLCEARERHPKLAPVFGSGRNQGKGAAIAAGVMQARGDYVLLADVDLSTPLEELPKLAQAVRDGADVAIGSRHVPGSKVERGPARRKVTGRTFSTAVRLLTGLEVQDTQNGFKLMPTDVAQRVLGAQICNGFAFDVEMLVRADLANLKIAEIPVLYIHDMRSKVSVASDSPQMMRELLRLSWRLKPRSGACRRGRTERR